MKLITMVFYLISPALADTEIPPPVPTERVHGQPEEGTQIRVPPTYTEESRHVWVGSELETASEMEGIWFRTTNSPCRDAVLANLNLNRCTGLQTVQDTQGIFEYTCNTPDVRSDVPWTTWTFVEIDRPLIEMGVVSPAAPVPLCVDVWIYLYAINPADSE